MVSKPKLVIENAQHYFNDPNIKVYMSPVKNKKYAVYDPNHKILDTSHGSGCSCRHAGSVASIYCGYNRAGNARGPGLNNRRRRPGFRHRRRDSEYPAPAREL